ncbi:MAG: SDR family oxidoreductase [Bacteroidota bacterium]
MDLGLKRRVAIVAASSQGLGKAAAMTLAQEGAYVVLLARDKKRIQAAAKEITKHAGKKSVAILPLVADVAKAKDITRVVQTTLKEFGRIDILVTNAGGPPSGGFMDLDDEKWMTGINLNLMSVIRFIRAVLPYMQKQKFGRIINITSLTVKQPSNDLIISSTVRPGIIGLSKVLSNLYAKDGITINNVAPGFIMTGRQQELGAARAAKKGISFEDYVAESSKEIPAGRFGKPDELASVIVFLASTKASYVNGVTLSVDGGLVKGLL